MERAGVMEANQTFPKATLIKYRLSKSILILFEYGIILGCMHYGGVHLNLLIYIAAFFGLVIGTFRRPVKRSVELFVTIPVTIYFGVNIFMIHNGELSIKIILLLLIVFTIIGFEIISNKLLDKLRISNH